MARRSRAREVALQLLFQHEHNSEVGQADITEFLDSRLKLQSLAEFARRLFEGVLAHRAALDEKLASVATNWAVDRMAPIDRNILRLGIYELLYEPETPPKVVLDESIELAKRYGAAESSSFVNGILDRIAAERLKG